MSKPSAHTCKAGTKAASRTWCSTNTPSRGARHDQLNPGRLRLGCRQSVCVRLGASSRCVGRDLSRRDDTSRGPMNAMQASIVQGTLRYLSPTRAARVIAYLAIALLASCASLVPVPVDADIPGLPLMLLVTQDTEAGAEENLLVVQADGPAHAGPCWTRSVRPGPARSCRTENGATTGSCLQTRKPARCFPRWCSRGHRPSTWQPAMASTICASRQTRGPCHATAEPSPPSSERPSASWRST